MTSAAVELALLGIDLRDFAGVADSADLSVVPQCTEPVLDVGCGPGRMVRALRDRGVEAVGVDLAPAAVEMARAAGVPVLRRDVFNRLPGEGRWATLLLIDGNIGIGGDPVALLRRCLQLLRPGGQVIVEAESDAGMDVRCRAEITDADGRRVFRHDWVRLGEERLIAHAEPLGLVATARWATSGRTFVQLTLPT